jgi:hypothetical protein
VWGVRGNVRFAVILGLAVSVATPVAMVTGRLVPAGAAPVETFAFSRADVAFGNQRLGTHGPLQIVVLRNTGTTAVTLESFGLNGADPLDFYGFTDCFPQGAPVDIPAGGHCRVGVYFTPHTVGLRRAVLTATDSASTSPQLVAVSGTGTEGYLLAGARGEVTAFGDAVASGNATALHLSAPVISLATTHNGGGYWLLGSDGGIFSYGNARFHGSTGAMRLNQPVVALSPSPAGNGYWLVAGDGGIFSFGDAHFYGSTGAIQLNQPIDGMASTPTGKGYWLVARDGGIFTFGDAHFYGSAGDQHLTSPVVQMTPTQSGNGYWLITADGHLYAYGDAHDYGSATGQAIVGMALTADGQGYWQATRNGNVFTFGDAHPFGDLRSLAVDDVVGIAATAHG